MVINDRLLICGLMVKKVWPIDKPIIEFSVDKTLVILNKDNNYHDTITVFASDTAEWEFGN